MQHFDVPPRNYRLAQRVYGLAEEVRGQAMRDLGLSPQERGRAMMEANQDLTIRRSRNSVRNALGEEGESASTAVVGGRSLQQMDNRPVRYPMDLRTVHILEELAEHRYRYEDSPIVKAQRRASEMILFDGQLYFLTDVQSRAVRIMVVASYTNYPRYCGPLEGIWFASLQEQEDVNFIQFEVVEQGVPSLWVVHDRNRQSATQLFLILERMLLWSRQAEALACAR